MTTRAMDLSGEWKLLVGNEEGDPQQLEFSDRIQLPGSLQEQGFGDEVAESTPWTETIKDRSWFTAENYEPYRRPGNIKIPFGLQPKRHYVGAAWYEREVFLPQEWQGRRIVLSLERPHIQTTVWIDGKMVGTQNSLAAPHDYDLGTGLLPGRHRLTICVDNRLHVDVGVDSHSVSDHTQTNWNGIVGRIELRATSPVWIEEAQVYPDIIGRKIGIHIMIGNSTGRKGLGFLRLGEMQMELAWGEEGGSAECVYSLPGDAALWDEFNPALHRLTLHLVGDGADHEREIVFGLRKIGVEGTQITVNGRRTFFRGALECSVFPKTGYPAPDLAEWKRILNVFRSYGLNHVRFHSWCPPEAAFQAADELGVYVQVECSSWANVTTGLGLGNAVDRWLYDEAAAVIKAYGNHPSFVLMAYGNEPGGDFVPYLTKWVEYWKKKEPRRLHTGAAGWPLLEVNDYQNIPEPRIHQWNENLKCRVNALPPATTADYCAFVEKTSQPIISHEIGQWCAYPDFSEISKYTGVLQARNFEIFRETLEAKHMGDQAHDFLMASGRLQVLCYKEEIESALRTAGFGGFQLLGASDFPGQGTALVGWLNAFWESKGYASPEAFKRFNNETVVLARLERRTFCSGETLRAEIEVAHFGAKRLMARPYWRLVDDAGKIWKSGELPEREIPVGNGIELGVVEISLSDLAVPSRYRLVAGLSETEFENDWDVWVYPVVGQLESATRSGGVIVVRDWKGLLEQAGEGRKILFMPSRDALKGDVAVGFSSIFWNTAWTENQAPHTLGILCDPQHPLFSEFPTDSHSNWQWWELVQSAGAMMLDPFPVEVRPQVQLIDDWFTNRRLGLLFEAKWRGSSLVVCSMDLDAGLDERHVARQLRKSVLDYMAGASFRPCIEISDEHLLGLFR